MDCMILGIVLRVMYATQYDSYEKHKRLREESHLKSKKKLFF